ncbi:hypothetical protein C8Q70DRAFT_1049489 [Cubamyces menziesii]|uniref:Uncharacterized protein n=1 Tax=Trametes cubensis TaxID=1111947 RepID=A0AAD7TJU1_9APHY|nr:hypothetical protein C8Q70DRAFT_1049489 [Cubamyces menziesii]KAJ8462096.1 hypothetical protein ONZ51_g11123 [Trametes cubensis]
MVAPMFILTCTFAISAMFVGAFTVTHAAPVPTAAAVAKSVISPRWCRQMGCLYALPEANSGSANSSDSSSATTQAPLPSDGSSAALQVIDLLISALQSVASTMREQSSDLSSLPSSSAAALDSSLPSAAESSESAEDEAIAADVAAIAKATQAEAISEEAPSTDFEEASSPSAVAVDTLDTDAESESQPPAVEVVGYSTVASTDVDSDSSSYV